MDNSSMFSKEIIKNNPNFIFLLGISPLLATTTNVVDAVGMGICTCIVFVFSNLIISLLSKFLSPKMRLFSSFIIIAGLTSTVDVLLRTFFPSLSSSLGIFIPLIAVNWAILTHAIFFASKSNWLLSLFDGLKSGIAFFLALFILASFREILGTGSFAGISLFTASFQPFPFFALPAGGFLLLGILLAFLAAIKNKFNKTRRPTI